MTVPTLAQQAFEKHSSQVKDGQRFMTLDDFKKVVSPGNAHLDLDDQTLQAAIALLFSLADKSHRGSLSLEDFIVFENLISSPDAEYQVAYRLFSASGKGKLLEEDFVKVISATPDLSSISLNFEADWFKLFVDPNSKEISYDNFVQLLKVLQDEKIKQAFKNSDPEAKGSISTEDFAKIFRSLHRHKLTRYINLHLGTIENLFLGRPITYASVIAFNNMLRELDLIDTVVREASRRYSNGFTRDEFVSLARGMTRFSRFSPLEFDLLFHFVGLENHSGKYTYEDFERIVDPRFDERKRVTPEEIRGLSFGESFLKQVYSFGLGSVAGAIGATFVYPIDLVKTRMQNQRKVVGEVLYKNSWDCFQKVVKNEGFRGLYRGLGPQLIGVAPEKAIKLTVNDIMRELLKNKETNKISTPAEIIAGGMAGGCQVIFTNPLEIVKIRLQVLGELAAKEAAPPRPTAIGIVRQLGLKGLYKGASACLLRDIPFSAIYFPTYAHVKTMMGETKDHKLSGVKLLLSGALAGMPAAYFCTPADVIKTRLQVEARKGQQTYTGIVDAAQKILKQEGWTAFFKGGPARVLRSSPQFGVTLLSYEVLQRNFPLYEPGKEKKEGKAREEMVPTLFDAHLNVLRSQFALNVLMDVDYKFGVWPLPPTVKKA